MNDEPVPIWISDYVLMGYGTGAIMAVPAHDERDFQFATRSGCPIVEVIAPQSGAQGTLAEAYAGDGVMVNSGQFDGLAAPGEAFEAIVAWLGERGAARKKINFKLSDWLISRQRYWGAPIPIVHCDACGPVPVPVEQLPVLLPDLEDYHPTDDGRSPLARDEEFVHTTCPRCGGPGRRETDTMDTFACSSWYHFRFASPHDEAAAFDRDKAEYWLPVDLYVGGAEHAVMHLLYARFFCKVAQDAGFVSFGEPYARLRNQGMIQAEDGQKMSKSKGNVVTPDSVVEQLRRRQPAPVRALHRAVRAERRLERPRGAGLPALPGPLLEPRRRGRRRRRAAGWRRTRPRPRRAARSCARSTRPSARSRTTSRPSASTPPSRRSWSCRTSSLEVWAGAEGRSRWRSGATWSPT